MSDIVERLKNTTTQAVGYMGDQEVSVSALQLEAAAEIERQRAENAEQRIMIASLSKEIERLGRESRRLRAMPDADRYLDLNPARE